MQVRFSKKAIDKIGWALKETNNKHETGGLLLGYKIFSFFIVSNITSLPTDKKTSISFALDGEKHLNFVLQTYNKALLKPFVIGVWHSHTINVETLSNQDKKANLMIAESLNGAVSVIVNNNRDYIKLTSYYINPKGRIIQCNIEKVKRSGLNE